MEKIDENQLLIEPSKNTKKPLEIAKFQEYLEENPPNLTKK